MSASLPELAATAAELDKEIISYIRSSSLDGGADSTFEELSLRLFSYQYEAIRPFRSFCDARGCTPATVESWRQVPAIPTLAFKHLDLTTADPSEAAFTFNTSGTTGQPGRVIRDFAAESVCRAAYVRAHKEFMLPDVESVRFLSLAPTPDLMPHAGVAHCLEFLRDLHGAEGSKNFFTERGPDFAAFGETLDATADAPVPVGIYGATFSLVHFIDRCMAEGRRFELPAGSRINHGSGFKGRSREVSAEEFLASASEVFGIDSDHVVNVLGMTELGSQFYDNVLRAAWRGQTALRAKAILPWTRVRVVDPESLEDVEGGGEGVLVFYDLSLRGNVLAVITEDIGVLRGEGFEILGRAADADLRGCALTVEAMLELNGQ